MTGQRRSRSRRAGAARPEQLFDGRLAAGVYAVAAPAIQVVAAARRAGWTTWIVDTTPRTKPELLDALARALALPAWFGGNWDALADALSDVRPPDPGGVLVWSDAGRVAATSPADWSTAYEILREATARAALDGTTLVVVCAGRSIPPGLPRPGLPPG